MMLTKKFYHFSKNKHTNYQSDAFQFIIFHQIINKLFIKEETKKINRK
jgi:hypothetical protein